MKIKVLLASPYGGVPGGITRWTEHVINFYNNKRISAYELDLLPLGRSTFVNINSPLWYRLKSAIKDYRVILKNYKAKIERNNYDIMHLCSSASISLIKDLYMLSMAKKHGLKTILHFHFGRIPDLFALKNWEYKLLVRALALADKVIVIDNKSHETLTRAGYKNIEFLPNPLTPAISTIIRENTSIVRQERKIVFAGHVIPTKGVFELVEACKQIPDIKVRMLGFVSDEMRTQLRQAAGENSETWLDIAGEQSYDATIKEMLSAGVFVLPTYTEGFPNVILESMACACPIVTTDVGAIPEMLDIAHGFNNGICVKPKDIEGLKTAIEKMLNQRDYALQCGLNARKRVAEQYSMPIVWDKLTSIWKSLNN